MGCLLQQIKCVFVFQRRFLIESVEPNRMQLVSTVLTMYVEAAMVKPTEKRTLSSTEGNGGPSYVVLLGFH